jgi:exodeoxyribonuclease-3
MKIISFNVNGIRSATSKGLFNWLEQESPDVFCVQEIKAQAEQIDSLSFHGLGYEHQLIFSAQKKGYSGVAIFSKIRPSSYHCGISYPPFDDEGRVIRADFSDLTVVCVYIPSGTMGEARQAMKMKFLELFTNYLLQLREERPNLIVCGDYNICHKAIDINHPERHTDVSGFLPEEREWFDSLIELGFIDSFRQFNHSAGQYSWWSFRSNARARNLGWRIDYLLVTDSLKHRLTSASILPHISMADHCPVALELD